MSKKYVTRRFRKLHKGRKGRKGYTTRKKMDGGWRMWNNVLSQFKNKINDVPALKQALDSYRNTGKDGGGKDKRTEILMDVVKICDKYRSNAHILGYTQFSALRDFVESNKNELHTQLDHEVDVEKRGFYKKLCEILEASPLTSQTFDVSTVQKQNLPRTRWGVITLLGDFKSKINNVDALKRLLDQYRGAGKENDKYREVIIDQVKRFISNARPKPGVSTDLKFIELQNLVYDDSGSQNLKTFIDDPKNPIDKREFYQAVYNSIISTALNVPTPEALILGPLGSSTATQAVTAIPESQNPAAAPVATLNPAANSSTEIGAAAAAPSNARVPAAATQPLIVPATAFQTVGVMPSSNSSSTDSSTASVPATPELLYSYARLQGTSLFSNPAAAVPESPNPAAAAGNPNTRVPATATQPLIAPTNMSLQATRTISGSLDMLPMAQHGRTTENVQNPDGTGSLGNASVLQQTLPMTDPPTHLQGVVDRSRTNPPAEGAMYSSTNQFGPSSQLGLTSHRHETSALSGQSVESQASYMGDSHAHGARRPNRRNVTLNLGGGTTYYGEVNDKVEPDGVGLMIYAGGNEYEGQFSNGVIDGYGTYKWANGDSYQGKFKNNKRNDGIGTYTWANGASYQGGFVNMMRNGLGTFNYANGIKYEGFWNNDMKDGLGTESYKDNGKLPDDEGGAAYSAGDVYIGNFKDGKRHGNFSYKFFNHMDEIRKGEYTYKDGKCKDFDRIQQEVHDKMSEQFPVHNVNEKGGPKHIGTGVITSQNHEGKIGYHGSFEGNPRGQEPHHFWVYPEGKDIGDKRWDTHDPESFCTNREHQGDHNDIEIYECLGHPINEEGDSEEALHYAGGTAYKPNRRKTNKKITRKRKSPRKSTRKSPRKSHRKSTRK